jgi:hypothetical protein
MTTWSISVPEIRFRVNKIVAENNETSEELFIDIPEGIESSAFLSMTKQLQNSMMKTARGKLPLKGVPAATAPQGANIKPIPVPPRQQVMPATPIMSPPPQGPTHKTMPVRPPMSPSAIRHKKGHQSASFGKLANEYRVIAERKAIANGTLPAKPVPVPSSYERLTSEVAMRKLQDTSVEVQAEIVEDEDNGKFEVGIGTGVGTGVGEVSK